MTSPSICLSRHSLGADRRAYDAKVAEVKATDEAAALDAHITAALIMAEESHRQRQNIIKQIEASAANGNFSVNWGNFQPVIDETIDSANNKDITITGNDNEQSESAPLGAAGDTALERVSAKNDRKADEGRNTGIVSDDGSRANTERASDSDQSGNASGERLGTSAPELHIPSRGSASQRRAGSDTRIPVGTGLAEDAERSTSQHLGAIDYRISNLTKLGEGGQRTKFNNNIAAIRLMRELQESGRLASPDEQDTLARYVGWGGISQAFDPENADWSKQHAELKSLLSQDEWDAAEQSTQYAHYTSQGVIDGIYKAIQHIGFSGGRILEPGSGVGNFIGLMPDAIRNNTRFTGVEREKIASGISKLLYPKQNIQQQDFTYFHADDGHFDAVIGNPPFASTDLTDMTGRKHLSGLSIHNYFFAKSIDLLRENGVLAMVVTSSFMDAKKDRTRSYIADRAELLGAIRLPNSAFMGNANTDVTTDIIFLKKRSEADWGSRAAKEDGKRWMDQSLVSDPLGGEDIPINTYFANNPTMMLGRMERTGGRYRADMAGLVAPEGADISSMLESAILHLPAGSYESSSVSKTKAMAQAASEAMSGIEVGVGGFFNRNGALYQRSADIAGESTAIKVLPSTKWSEKTTLGQTKYDKLVAAANIRSTLRELIAAESSNKPTMDTLRAVLNNQYDQFTKKFGFFNDRATVQLLGDDPDFPLMLSLEHSYDPGITDTAAKKQGVKPQKPSAKKSAIFVRSILDARAPVTSADSPVDALMISIAERGRIDHQFIGELLGRDGTAVLDELTQGENPELFIDPSGNGYVLKDEYLSGNVRKKLALANSAGMDANARALTAILPVDVPSHEIQGKLGAPWIPTATYEEFARHLLGEETKAHVSYVPALNAYNVSMTGMSNVANTNTYGIREKTAEQIFNSLLNNKEIKVGYTNKEGQYVLLKKETDEALDKAMAMREAFGDWLMADADRSEMLTREYNDKMNNYVVRKFNGTILSFPGKVSDLIIKFRRHQRNAISRIIQDGRGLLDHVVGAGKTFTVIGAAMELKRTGLAKKSMIAVPNHLVKQWAADFYRLYPGANILTATKKDFLKANRRKFLAKIATGDWDAVVIAHSSFGFIKPDPAFEAEFNKDRIKEIMTAIRDMGDAKNADQQTKRTIKQLAKMRENLEQRIKSLRDKPMDDLLDLGQLGVDQLFVDEAHMFKNLMFTTKMQNVRGLGQPEGSQRAYDMFVKTRQITAANGGTRGVVFATGTPVSNSLAEMYHMMRYLAPETLGDMGHQTFDAWANTFAEVEQVWMQAMSGDGYKSTNRMSKFVNTPDLLKAFNQVADTVTMDDIQQAFREENDGKDFPIPKLKGGRRTPISLVRTVAQNEYMDEIASRAKKLEQRKGKPEKGEDNMLSILGDARKAAMDMRMVDPSITERDPQGRIAIVAQNVFDTYQQFDDVRGTQLIFSDMGTPKKTAAKELAEYQALLAATAPLKDESIQASADLGDESAISIIEAAELAQADMDSRGKDWLDAIQAAMRGFSIYDDTKAALIEQGIPEHEIAFIHDFNTDEQKAALFRAVNDGKIRVLMGSTPKMGAGTNVQERLVELHHMDVPWKPSDIEQREGRIVRQGNLLLTELGNGFEVSIKAYATQDTLDLFMWQVQEKKLGMINQLRTGQVGREMDDAFEELQMSAGEMQAAATSNPYLLEEIQLKDQVKKLERKKKSFEGQRNDLLNRKKRAEAVVRDIPNQLIQNEEFSKIADEYQATLDDRAFSMSINGVRFTNAEEASEKLRALTDDVGGDTQDQAPEAKRVKMSPVDINGLAYKSKTAIAEAFRRIAGDGAKISFTRNGETYIRRADIVKAVKADVLKAAQTDDTIRIGNLGGFAFSVTGEHNKLGNVSLIVSAEVNGTELAESVQTSFYSDLDALSSSGINEAIRKMELIISRPGQSIKWLKDDLASAKKTLAEISKVDFSQVWDGGSELDIARDRYREVLKKINEAGVSNEAAGDTASGEVKFSNDRTSINLPESEWLSVASLVDHVDKLVEPFKTTIPIVVLDTVSAVNPAWANEGTVTSGLTYDGKVFLFRDGLSNFTAVTKTLFHELLHLGLDRFLTPTQYIQEMGKLYASDAWVRNKAKLWMASDDAQMLSKTHSPAYVRARGVDEALAELSEIIHTQPTGYNHNDVYSRAIRVIREWVAKLADRFGFNEAAQDWRGFAAQQDARNLIADTFSKLHQGISPAVDPDLIWNHGHAMFSRSGKSDGDVSSLGQSQDASNLPVNEHFKSKPRSDVLIANQLGVLSMHPDYLAAKSGDANAAIRLISSVVEPDFISKVKDVIDGQDVIIQPVTAVESAGKNWIPMVAAAKLSESTGAELGTSVVQSTVTKRTAANGIDRIFKRPSFAGTIVNGKKYFLVDDTVTQGGTIAALINYIESNGGEVIGSAVLTGKDYSAKIALSPQTLKALRDKHGDIEDKFRAARGYGFDDLTESEARYLANFKPPIAVRDRISAEGERSGSGSSEGILPQSGGNGNQTPRFRRSIATSLQDSTNSIRNIALPAGYIVDDLFNNSGKLNWWHKTVGTQYNLAKRSPLYATVYNRVQNFINDVSLYAAESADLAPTILPKLDNLSDVWKKPLTSEDTKAISKPIFEGTLSWTRDSHGKPVPAVNDEDAGIVWSPSELSELFGLSAKQIALYQEFRSSIDRSLTNLAISEMVKMGGEEAKLLTNRAMDTQDAKAAGEMLREHFENLAQTDASKRIQHQDTAQQMTHIADKVSRLIERGYAPLSRYGNYSVYVKSGEEQVYFGMFENKSEAAKMARKMREAYPNAEVVHGTMSGQSYKLFNGVSPETAELFGNMLGLDANADGASHDAFQKYLKLAKNNRSAMKRMIQRKGVAGFGEDAGRTLAGFVYSNARLTSHNLHAGEMNEAIEQIPSNQGELKDAAVELAEHVKNPINAGTKLGGVMFAQYLGGSVASAMVNLTQPVMMTFPYLSQYGGIAKASSRMISAINDARRESTGDPALDAALKIAEEEGIVSPQEVHHLQAQAAGSGVLQAGDGTSFGNARANMNNIMQKIGLGWGKLFSMAESANRRITFIAAYRTAVDEGIENPSKFAEDAIASTQGIYNAGNKPRWARGTLGGLAMTFKQYSIAYVELLDRMWNAGAPGTPERAAGRKGAVLMIAVLMLMSGIDGLPFEQDLEDFVDGMLQRFGYNFSTKRSKQQFLIDALGDGGADFVLKGASGMPGMPIDVAGRFGMGNLIPATGLFTKKASHASDLAEIAGAPGDLAKRAFGAAGKALGGEFMDAATDIMPASVRNVQKGFDMYRHDAYRDERGYKVVDTTPLEALMKMIGFQPNSVAHVQSAKGQALDMISQTRMASSAVQEHWAQGILANDATLIQEAREMRDAWNEKNPDTPIKSNMPAIIKRVREMKMAAIERTQKTSPHALKDAVRRELSQGALN